MSKKSIVGNASQVSGSSGSAGADSRRHLVLAAYQLIAEKGFEGLRTREVADRVGLNHATLHYYFPKKEDLVRGVVDYLIQQFISEQSSQSLSEGSPVDLLRAEFVKIMRLHKRPEMIIVLNELSLRALRDPIIAKLLAIMDRGWWSYLSDILRKGVQKGDYKGDIDIGLGASIVMTVLKGIRGEIMGKTQKEVRQICSSLLSQLERWLAI